jgi:hypothetical protein
VNSFHTDANDARLCGCGATNRITYIQPETLKGEKMAKITAFVAVLLIFPLAAIAEDYPKAEVFGGFSIFSGSLASGNYDDFVSMLGTAHGRISIGSDIENNFLRGTDGDNRNQFYGFQANVAGNFHKNVGIVVDFGYQYKNLSSPRFETYEYLFGPQFSMR